MTDFIPLSSTVLGPTHKYKILSIGPPLYTFLYSENVILARKAVEHDYMHRERRGLTHGVIEPARGWADSEGGATSSAGEMKTKSLFCGPRKHFRRLLVDRRSCIFLHFYYQPRLCPIMSDYDLFCCCSDLLCGASIK